MKRCPTCDQTYSHELLQFCRFDGTPLVDASWQEAPTALLTAAQRKAGLAAKKYKRHRKSS